jgi:hypothetical protein
MGVVMVAKGEGTCETAKSREARHSFGTFDSG